MFVFRDYQIHDDSSFVNNWIFKSESNRQPHLMSMCKKSRIILVLHFNTSKFNYRRNIVCDKLEQWNPEIVETLQCTMPLYVWHLKGCLSFIIFLLSLEFYDVIKDMI